MSAGDHGVVSRGMRGSGWLAGAGAGKLQHEFPWRACALRGSWLS